MQQQVIIKTSTEQNYINACTELAPDLPFMPIVKSKNDLQNFIHQNHKLNLIGAEILFTDDSSDIVSDEFIAFLHNKGLKLWGNAIIYDYKAVLSGGHTDDVAVTGNPDYGWGWFAEKGFDIVQTDWCFQMKQYYNSVCK